RGFYGPTAGVAERLPAYHRMVAAEKGTGDFTTGADRSRVRDGGDGSWRRPQLAQSSHQERWRPDRSWPGRRLFIMRSPASFADIQGNTPSAERNAELR